MFRSPSLQVEEMEFEIMQAEDQEKACGNWPPVGVRREYIASCYDALDVLREKAERLAFLEID